MSSKNDKTDCECCNVISKSVQTIIRWSLNDQFREKCFKLLEVDGSLEAENKVRIQLTEINNLSRLKVKPRKLKEIKRLYDSKEVETSAHKKLLASSVEKVSSTNSLVPVEDFPMWDLEDINVADIDNWN